MPKIVKRIFIFLFAIIALIIIAAIAIPYFFKDEIVAKIKEDINKNVNAEVDFSDVDLSLLRSFPNFNFQLKDFEIQGIDQFKGIMLVGAENLEFTLDLMSVINKDQPIAIESIALVKPEANILVLRNGTANYEILKEDGEPNTPTTSETAAGEYNFLIQLQKYSITGGKFSYIDKQGDLELKLTDLDHEGSGDFTQDVFDLKTQTNIRSISMTTGGIRYLNRVTGDFDVTLGADIENNTYTFKDNDLRLNALRLIADGSVQVGWADINIDIKFQAPENEFKNFLSLVPSAYAKNFEAVTANGKLAFNGFVKGNYNATKGTIPAFKVNLDIENGDFKYPDLPLGVKNIQAKATINSPSSNLDKMTVDIPNFSMLLGDNPFKAKLNLKTLLSDPNVDADIDGVLNLANLAKAFPMEGVKTMNGVITAKLLAKAKMSDMDRKDYENVNMQGKVQVQDLVYSTTDLPTVRIEDMKMDFNPKNVTLDNFTGQLGKSDIKAKGSLDNILAYFSPDKTMKGTLVVRSDYFNADEWMPAEETSTTTPAEDPNAPAATTEIFDRFDFTLDAIVNQIDYDVYELKNMTAKGNFTPNKISFTQFKTDLGKSDFAANGTINNVFNYLFEGEVLTGKLNLTAKFIDLNEFMQPVPEASPTAKTIANENNLQAIQVPPNIDLNLSTDIRKIRYTNIDLDNLDAQVGVKNKTVSIKNATARALGGDIAMTGDYNTLDATKPTFDMDYQVSKLDFQTAFEKLNTFQMLAPIGKYIEGKFNTKINLKGVIGNDLLPDLNTLSADGLFTTINAIIRNLKPLEKVSSLLNLKSVETIKLENTKNKFRITNGVVEIDPFEYAYKDIDMNISGKHGLNQEMNYDIIASIPRKMLEQNSVTAAANQGINLINAQAKKFGVPLDLGNMINIKLNLTGSITAPKVQLKVLGSKDGKSSIKDVVNDVIDTVKDSVKTVVTNTINTAKDSVKTVVKDETEKLKKKADAEIKAIMTAAEKQANAIKETAKKTAAKAKAEGYKQADKLVSDAGGNFFKKKAAEIAAKELKKETDKKTQKIVDEADKRADQIMKKAEQRTDAVRKKYKL